MTQPSKTAKTASLREIGLDHFAPYLMNRVAGRYNHSLRKKMVAQKLTTAKMRVLAVLSVHEGLSINALCVFSVVEQSTLSRALDGLQRDGLVRRETDADDNRAVHIFLTQQGQATFQGLWPAMVDGYEQMFENISAPERAAFVGTLQKMLVNIRENDF